MCRSARRQTVRARCSAAPAGDARRQDEPPQGRQLGLGLVNPGFQARRVLGAEHRLGHAGGNLRRRVGQLRAQSEQVALQAIEPGVQRRVHAGGPRLPQHGVELVDVAVRVHARIGLADARAVKQRRLAGVAGSRVDLHVSDYTE